MKVALARGHLRPTVVIPLYRLADGGDGDVVSDLAVEVGLADAVAVEDGDGSPASTVQVGIWRRLGWGEEVEVGDGVVVAGAAEESDDDDAGRAAFEGVLDGDIAVGALFGVGMGFEFDADGLEVEEVVALEGVEVADGRRGGGSRVVGVGWLRCRRRR